MCEQKFFICKHCGNLMGLIHNSGVEVVCCGDPMTELIPNTVDAAKEKHVPVVTTNDDSITINVGSVDHPMIPEHFIQWIYLQTANGGQRRCLNPGDAPNVTFTCVDDKPIAAYAYCNLHGLWKTSI